MVITKRMWLLLLLLTHSVSSLREARRLPQSSFVFSILLLMGDFDDTPDEDQS